MTIDKTEIISTINLAMDELVSSYNTLKSLILNPENRIQGQTICPETGEETQGNHRENLVKALGNWDIHPTSTTGEVMRYLGYYMACEEIISATHNLNSAKENLTKKTKMLTASGATEREIREAYKKIGFPKIHPLQARRQIKIVNNENLKRISFSVAKRIESIEKISVELACKRLEKNDAHDIIALMANLNPTDIVRWHKPVGTHIRANIVHVDENKNRQAKMIHTSLPIIIDGNGELPKVVFNHPKEHRKKRSDTLSGNRVKIPFIKDGYLSFDC